MNLPAFFILSSPAHPAHSNSDLQSHSSIQAYQHSHAAGYPGILPSTLLHALWPSFLSSPEVTALVDMHMGDAEATAWGCDLSYDYVKINADYRS